MSSPATGAGSALAPKSLTQNQEALIIAAVSGIIGLFILKSLPSGIFALLLSLFIGLLLGLAAAISLLVYAFYKFTTPAPRRSIPVSVALASSSGRASPDGQQLTQSSETSRDVTRPHATMPHAYGLGGELNGILFSTTISHWERNQCVLDWPPSGPAFTAWSANLSQGTLILVPLQRPHHHHRHQHHQKDGQGSTKQAQHTKQEQSVEQVEESGIAGDRPISAQRLTTEQAQQQQKVGIPLEGCEVELVRDGLFGRSESVRRAPLLLTHPSWPLLNGEKGIYIFATDPAAKQQWLHALSFWCHGGTRLRTVDATYAEFCAVMAQKSLLPFIKEDPPGRKNIRNAGATTAATDNRGGPGSAFTPAQRDVPARESLKKKGSWKKWRRGGSSSSLPDVAAGAAGGGDYHGQNAVDTSTAEISQSHVDQHHTMASVAVQGRTINDSAITGSTTAPQPAADIDSIIEQRWMQSRKVPVPPAPQKQRHSGLTSSAASSLTSTPSTSPAKVPPMQLGTALEQMRELRKGSAKAPPLTALGGARPAVQIQKVVPMAAEGEQRETVTVEGVSQLEAAPTGAGASPRIDATLPSAAGSVSSGGGPEEHLPLNGNAAAAAVNGGATAAATVAAAPSQSDHPDSSSSASSRLPPGFPSPLLPPDYFMNAASTRICFDLIRNPAFAEYVRARVQRQLSRMHTPDYVQSLEVVSVDLGNTAPSIANFAAVPQPGGAVWPQIVFDFKYNGSFTVTIECKVDIRDAPAWSALDSAIDRLEGKKRKGVHSTTDASRSPRQGTEEGWDDLAYSDSEQLEEQLLSRNGGAMASSSSGSSSVNGDDEEGDGTGREDSAGGEIQEAVDSAGGVAENAAMQSKSNVGSPRQQPKRRLLGKIRHRAAQKLRKLAENTATRIARIPLRVSLTFSALEGTMCAWIPPPPGDRLFWSFLSPPKLSLKAVPQLGPRLLKYAYHASRASAWIQARMELSFKKNLVFPCGGDLLLPLLLPSWDPRAADGLPGLEKEKEKKKQERQRHSAAAPSASAAGNVRFAVPESMAGAATAAPPFAMEQNGGGDGSAAPFVQLQLRRPAAG